jgi:hypothetical protein
LIFVVSLTFGQEKPEVVRHKFKFGPKAAFLVNHPLFLGEKLDEQNEENGENPIEQTFNFGYSGGGMMSYRVTDRYWFQTELLYTYKTKKLTGGVRDLFEFTGDYHFVELPVMCRVNYKMNGWGWYFNIGGRLSYWLKGSGTFYNFEISDAGVKEAQTYSISFGEKTSNWNPNNTIYVTNPNRLQFGLDFGFGFDFYIAPKRALNLDFRCTYGQSWMANNSPIFFGLFEYSEELRHSIGMAAVSIAYVFDYDPMEKKKKR